MGTSQNGGVCIMFLGAMVSVVVIIYGVRVPDYLNYFEK